VPGVASRDLARDSSAAAVLSIQSGINKVRYATLKGIMAAKKKGESRESEAHY
jgi:electron transfer flavoprotein alpha/beta subunit